MTDPEAQRSPAHRAWASFNAWLGTGKVLHKRLLCGAVAGSLLGLLFAAFASVSDDGHDLRMALGGKKLFESLLEQQPELRRNSSIAAAAGQGHNQMVLPVEMWKELQTDQRNSLALWLDSLDKKWEIRVGKLAADGWRIVSQQAVITSRQWHQQLK